ncbi:hypothetical protein HYU10_01375 [Candidatus Woesearchaeota archaeon]|nr:hypothetical protein [Candidatus Woesearchaeota archaeon]MBI2130398.1 hypothetical protein [Candidatus Woesearchaeota archaeon]MBI2661319.1 hypothetical protein [Candidatus Woesearchaeota archaeon]
MPELKIKISDKLDKELKESGIDTSILVDRLVKQIEEEKGMTDWSVKLQHAGRKGRLEELRRKGLI